MLFAKSRVYELALSSITPEHAGDFFTSYIPHISPLLAEHGGRFAISGAITSAAAGRFPAKTFAVLEWPSIDRFAGINEDARAIPLVQRRNGYLDFIMEGCFYRVARDIEFACAQDTALTVLLTGREAADGQGLRLHWVDDERNTPLAPGLYLSHDRASRYDADRDVEEYAVQVLKAVP